MKITSLVDTALKLRAEIEALTATLDTIEEEIRKLALQGEQIPLEDPELEGRQYLAQGTTTIIPVILTSDLITQTFSDQSPVHFKLTDIAGPRLSALYRPTVTHKIIAKTGKHFRLEASAQLGDTAPAFIAAATNKDKYGIPRSQIKIAYDRAFSAP